MNNILYKSINDLLSEDLIEMNNISNDIDITKLSIYIDSLLMNIPSQDLVINNSNEDIVRGLKSIEYLYFFIKGNVKLSDKNIINSSWRGKRFCDLNNSLKQNLLSNTIRVIYIEEKFIKYY